MSFIDFSGFFLFKFEHFKFFKETDKHLNGLITSQKDFQRLSKIMPACHKNFRAIFNSYNYHTGTGGRGEAELNTGQ